MGLLYLLIIILTKMLSSFEKCINLLSHATQQCFLVHTHLRLIKNELFLI